MMSRPRAVIVAGLLTGAAGIAVLWLSGRISWPVYPPPGIVVLIVGALLVRLSSRRWVPGLATVMGLVMFVGVQLSGGPRNLVGQKGPAVAAGNWIMIAAGLVTVIAGAVAIRSEHRRQGRE